ncbi:DUF397 domain-containing protein [Streptomyces sp. SGAir0957]
MNPEVPEQVALKLAWRTSSHSTGQGGECVEVAAGVVGVHVRDTKDRDRGTVDVPPSAWSAFVGFAARG